MQPILVACDKFKGSLDASQVTSILTAEMPESEGFIVADGGDGTIDAFLAAGYHCEDVTVSGPTGAQVKGRIAFREETLVVELAELVGMLRLPNGTLEPLKSTTIGLGEALRFGSSFERIIVGLGGSASTDGGAGLLVGLGARLLDANGQELYPDARSLAKVARLDLSQVPRWVSEKEWIIASDVDAPLLGQDGCVRVFGPQKGLTGQDADEIEIGMRNWADSVADATGRRNEGQGGSGAAGGAGFALMAVLGARVASGIEVILNAIGFETALNDARLVVTGEGSLDEQTLMGKTVAGVARLATSRGVPVVAVCGRSSVTEAALKDLGVSRVYSLLERAHDSDDSIARAEELLRDVARDIWKEW